MPPGGKMYGFPGHFGENPLPYGRHQCLPYSKDAVHTDTFKQQGTSKNYPFAFWADLLPSQCVLKIPQYIQYSGISKTFVRTKSLAQNSKK